MSGVCAAYSYGMSRERRESKGTSKDKTEVASSGHESAIAESPAGLVADERPREQAVQAGQERSGRGRSLAQWGPLPAALIVGVLLAQWARATSVEDMWMVVWTLFGALGLWAVTLVVLRHTKGAEWIGSSPDRMTSSATVSVALIIFVCLLSWLTTLVFAYGMGRGQYEASPAWYVGEAVILAAVGVGFVRRAVLRSQAGDDDNADPGDGSRPEASVHDIHDAPPRVP